MSDERMSHPRKGRELTPEKLDRARKALADVLRCEEVSGYAVQDLERAQRTLDKLYRHAAPRSR